MAQPTVINSYTGSDSNQLFFSTSNIVVPVGTVSPMVIVMVHNTQFAEAISCTRNGQSFTKLSGNDNNHWSTMFYITGANEGSFSATVTFPSLAQVISWSAVVVDNAVDIGQGGPTVSASSSGTSAEVAFTSSNNETLWMYYLRSDTTTHTPRAEETQLTTHIQSFYRHSVSVRPVAVGSTVSSLKTTFGALVNFTMSAFEILSIPIPSSSESPSVSPSSSKSPSASLSPSHSFSSSISQSGSFSKSPSSSDSPSISPSVSPSLSPSSSISRSPSDSVGGTSTSNFFIMF